MAISKRLRFEILRRDGHRCFYCHDGEKKLTVDHVIPIALGGTDDPTNLVAACKDCNGGKTSIQPDSPLVARVHDDAMRWQMAWTAAVAEATKDGAERAKQIAKVKKSYVAAYRGRHDENPILPEGWEASIGRWLDLGLPLGLIDKAIASSVGRNHIRADKRWNYFSGCCWSMLRELGDRTRQIAEAVTETTDERLTRAVIDLACTVWLSAWHGTGKTDPTVEQGEVAREVISDLYVDDATAGQVISAAELAGESCSADVHRYVDYGDEEPQPFVDELIWSYYCGVVDNDGEAAFSLTPERWTTISGLAAAAEVAGYERSDIMIAAMHAGSALSTDLLAFLWTAGTVLDDGRWDSLLSSRIAEMAVSQEQLDASHAKARENAAVAAGRLRDHKTECTGCGWCGHGTFEGADA